MASFWFKDASNLPSHFKRECLGVRNRETEGRYSENAVERCVSAGIQAAQEPELGTS